MKKDTKKNQEPSLIKKAENLCKAGCRSFGALVNGERILVSDLEKSNRLVICSKCEFFTEKHKCSKCGCYLEFKKRLTTEKCPIGKW